MASSHTLDQLDTCFDDTHAVANAGLLLAAILAERLGIEQTADALIAPSSRASVRFALSRFPCRRSVWLRSRCGASSSVGRRTTIVSAAWTSAARVCSDGNWLIGASAGYWPSGQVERPGGVAANEDSKDLDHRQPVGSGVVCDTFKGVDSAQADVEPVSTELVDRAGEPLSDLAFLGEGDLLAKALVAVPRLLAGEFELFTGALVAVQRQLTGLLERFPADANLP
jgi:hypothetical protein